MNRLAMRAFVGRAARCAVPMDSAEFDSLVSETAGDHRVLALGESHHFVHETYVLRARVLSALAGTGFRHLGAELSRTDGAVLQRYLETADPAVLALAGTFGHLGPGDRPYDTGPLATAPSAYPAAAMRGEYQRLLDTMRAGAPWSAFGFDVDYLPGLADERLTRVTDEIERARCVATLEASRRYDAAVRAAANYAELAQPMAWRENLMFEHVVHELAVRPVDERIVIAGHNLHVGPGLDRVTLPGGVGPGGGIVPPLGSQLEQAGVPMSCVWMLHDHGTDSGPPPGDGRVRSVRGSLNAALAEVGESFALRPADLPELAAEWAIATMYGVTVTAPPAQVCELILFTATTSPLQP